MSPKHASQKSTTLAKESRQGSLNSVPAHASVPAAALGRFVGILPDGRPGVEIDGREEQGVLSALCATNAELGIGDTLALAYVGGHPLRPVIIGRLQSPRVAGDPDRELVLTAEHQITLRCGKSSLILTRAGKLLLRGAYVSSHSSGVNRIKGGSVQIN